MTIYIEKIQNIISKIGFNSEYKKLDILVNKETTNELFETYKNLGGINPIVPIQLNYAISFSDYYIIIDDVTHFNKYRLITLENSIYTDIKSFNLESYKRMCRNLQSECLKSASIENLWHNKISEQYFGISSEIKDLSFHGSSQWKMQAFEDFLTDATLMNLNTKYKRISLFENIMTGGQLQTLKSLILKKGNESTITKFFERKLTY